MPAETIWNPRPLYLSPSYRRATIARTHLLLSRVRYVVAESEADAYRQQTGSEPMVVPDSVQGNVARVRNWVLDNVGHPYVVMLDDDFLQLFRYVQNERRNMEEAEFYEFVDRAFLLAKELGCRLWGINPTPDKMCYREYTPLSFTQFIGGPLSGHLLEDNPIRYDERIPLKEDYDLTLQHLNRYRRVLRFNGVFYRVDQHKAPGGCAAARTFAREIEQFRLLQEKWGSRIVRMDPGICPNSSRVKRGTYDLNPILRAPIKGI